MPKDRSLRYTCKYVTPIEGLAIYNNSVLPDAHVVSRQPQEATSDSHHTCLGQQSGMPYPVKCFAYITEY